MPRREFQPTEGLMEDTMRKQAASLPKAILEGVMNSIDAEADTIEVNISENEVNISDDGVGIDPEQLDDVFSKFGSTPENDADKSFGKFQIGRGQMFNYGINIWHTGDTLLIVNINGDEARIREDFIGDDDDEAILEKSDGYYTVDTEGLGYVELPAASENNGTHVSIDLFEELENVDGTVQETKDLVQYIPWLHDVQLEVNNSPVNDQLDPDYETDEAYFSIERSNFSPKISLYNLGAHVKEIRGYSVRGEVVTKQDLDLTMDRQEVMETDEVYEQIKKDLKKYAIETLLDSDKMNDREAEWILSHVDEDTEDPQRILSIPMLKDVRGDRWAIEQLRSKQIVFAPDGDRLARQEMDRGNVVALLDRYEDAFNDFSDSIERDTVDVGGMEVSKKNYQEFLDENVSHEMRKVDEDGLSKRRKKNLRRARWFLEEVGFNGAVVPGHSQTRDSWMSKDGDVVLDRTFLNSNKDEFLTSGLIEIMTSASQTGDSRMGNSESMTERRNFYNFAQHMGEAQRKLQKGKANI